MPGSGFSHVSSKPENVRPVASQSHGAGMTSSSLAYFFIINKLRFMCHALVTSKTFGLFSTSPPLHLSTIFFTSFAFSSVFFASFSTTMADSGTPRSFCAHYEECRLESYTATGKGLRKNQPKCFETCPNFREEVCHRLARPPFVCNGCAKEHNCPMRKKYYIPEAAQANYEGTLRNSRTGIHPDEKKVKAMNDVISPALKKGPHCKICF